MTQHQRHLLQALADVLDQHHGAIYDEPLSLAVAEGPPLSPAEALARLQYPPPLPPWGPDGNDEATVRRCGRGGWS